MPGTENNRKVKNFFLLPVTLLLSAGVMILMINDWIKISESKTNIETLDDLLAGVKKLLPDNSTVSFITNMDESKDIYFKTQFVLVPKILTGDLKNDTLLVIESAGKKSVRTDAADTLYIFSKHNLTVKLLRK